jgi:hypothetical protein
MLVTHLLELIFLGLLILACFRSLTIKLFRRELWGVSQHKRWVWAAERICDASLPAGKPGDKRWD